MAEESDLERTEPASSRRLEQAREEGNVPRSRELGAFMVLATGVGGCWALGEWLSTRSSNLLKAGLEVSREAAFDPAYMTAALLQQSSEAMLTLAPLVIVIIVAAIVSPMMIGGWNFSLEALEFKFERLNPIEGIKKLVSPQGVAELVKATLKSSIVGWVIYWAITEKQAEMFAMLAMPVRDGLLFFMNELLWCSLLIVGGVFIIAAIDVPFQLWQYYSRLRMTRQELQDEGKQTDGNPELKGMQRRQQRETAKRRMMQEVPTADVVVTNPTHFAVALRYDSKTMQAPQVVAKGRNLIAANIRELAQAHGVPILEAPPLARALYKHAEEGSPIPATLYTAVAEVMAWVYQLSAFIEGKIPGMLPPTTPETIGVPDGLDPGVPNEVAA